LQYFAGALDGQVNSFNFDVANQVGRGSLAGLGYSICFRKETGFCRIQFEAPFFQLSATVTDASPARNRRDSPPADTTIDSSLSTTNSPPFIPATGPLTCADQDRLSFPPSVISTEGLGIGGSLLCGSVFNAGQPLVVDTAPIIVQVANQGQPGLGFSLRFKYFIC